MEMSDRIARACGRCNVRSANRCRGLGRRSLILRRQSNVCVEKTDRSSVRFNIGVERAIGKCITRSPLGVMCFKENR